MTNRVYNFSAGPAMLPTPVMQKIQEEFLDYQGLGASIVEVSHRLPIFREILETPVASMEDLAQQIETRKSGEEVTVRFIRKEKVYSVVVELILRPRS